MKLCTSWIAAVAVTFAIGASTVHAADVYWDINGANTGATDDAGGVASSVLGFNADAFWSADPNGLSATTNVWVPNDIAHFSAGTNATGTSVITGTATVGGLFIEEGKIQMDGTLTFVANTNLSIAAGATLNANSSLRLVIPTGSTTVATLNGVTAVYESSNTGNAGSFIDGDADFNLVGGGTFKYSGGANLNILNTSSLVTGTGDLHIDAGNGAIGFAGLGSYTGNTIIDGGELRIRTSTNRLPITTNVVVNSPGILNLNSVTTTAGQGQEIASLSGNGDVGTGGATLTISGSSTTVFDGALKNIANFPTLSAGTTTGNGRLVKNGTGGITFNGVNDITGSVTLNNGAITVSASGSLCGDIADITITGGILTLNNAAETVENFGGTGGSVVLNGTILTTDPTTAATAANTTYAGTISGTGGLVKQNTIAGIAKTLSLTGVNTYSGGTTVTSGRVNSNSDSGTGSAASAVTVNDTGVLGGYGHVLGAVTVNSGGQLTAGVGLANGNNLSADNTVHVLSGGALNLMVGAPTSAPSGDYNNNGVVDGADYVVWRNASSTAVLPNDVTPGTVNASDYTVFRSNFGSTTVATPQADVLNVTTANALTLDAGSAITISGGGSVTPSGTYTVLKYNTGYTGTLASLGLNNATGVEMTGGIVDNTTAKTFEVTLTGVAQVRSWTAAGDGNWSFDPADAGNWTSPGQPNGPGATGNFASTGAHTVTISDSDKTLGTLNFNNTSGYTIASVGPQYRLNMNTYSGNAAINVTSGSHTISAPMYISKATTATVTNASDALSITGNIGLLAGLTKDGAGSVDISGFITSSGSVTVSAGTLTLSGQNSYTGGTTVAAGATLIAANTGTTSATGGTGANIVNGTLNVISGARTTNPTTINAGGIESVEGTTTGANTVSGGTLDVGTAGVITGTATMSAGGKLQNQGQQSAVQIASVAVQSTGHFAPGGIGAVGAIKSSTTGTLNFSAGGIFDIDVGSAGFDQFQYGNTTANTIGLTVAAGAIMKVNDIGGMTAGVYPIMSLGATPDATRIALFNNFVFTGSAAGFTYGLGVSGTTVNLTVTGAGSGSGLDGGGAVPEPTTLGMVGVALLGISVRRRNRKS